MDRQLCALELHPALLAQPRGSEPDRPLTLASAMSRALGPQELGDDHAVSPAAHQLDRERVTDDVRGRVIVEAGAFSYGVMMMPASRTLRRPLRSFGNNASVPLGRAVRWRRKPLGGRRA